MAHRAHAIGIMGRLRVSNLEIEFGSVHARRHRRGARFARQRNQRDRALARSDRLCGMPERDDVGAAAGLRRVEMAQFRQAEIIRHRQNATRRIAGAEIAVHIGFGQTRIGQRALGAFGMELGGRFIRRMPGRVLINPGDVGFALDAQRALPAHNLQRNISPAGSRMARAFHFAPRTHGGFV